MTDANDIGLGEYSGPRRRICAIPDCDRTAVTRGLCAWHYKRLMRHGSPFVVIDNHARKNVKLSPAKVVEIKRMHETGMTYKAIAKVFDVDRTTVNKAALGINWAEPKHPKQFERR